MINVSKVGTRLGADHFCACSKMYDLITGLEPAYTSCMNDSIHVRPVRMRQNGVIGVALCTHVGDYTLLTLEDDSLDIRLYASNTETQADADHIHAAMREHVTASTPLATRLARAIMQDGCERWAVRFDLSTAPVPASVDHGFMSTLTHPGPVRPMFLLLASAAASEKGMAPALFQWPQYAMAVASEVSDALVGEGVISWKDVAIKRYTIN